ncbi:MAG: YbjN domain-containing protein [Lyngbya sp.]|nr:YbjN domain-containing protein [Lyngbya sp.]
MIASEQNPETVTKENLPDRPLFEVMLEFFDEDGWVFKEIDHRRVVALGIEGKNGRFDCYMIAREEEKQLSVYSVFPVRVPDYKRYNVAALITMINYGILIGNFEMNFSDGEIRYKTSLDVEGDRLSSTLVKHLVYANVTTMDKYLPAIMSVIFGNLSPEEVISRIEN